MILALILTVLAVPSLSLPLLDGFGGFGGGCYGDDCVGYNDGYNNYDFCRRGCGAGTNCLGLGWPFNRCGSYLGLGSDSFDTLGQSALGGDILNGYSYGCNYPGCYPGYPGNPGCYPGYPGYPGCYPGYPRTVYAKENFARANAFGGTEFGIRDEFSVRNGYNTLNGVGLGYGGGFGFGGGVGGGFGYGGGGGYGLDGPYYK